MINIIEKLDADKEQDIFLSLSKEEQDAFLEEILVFANENKSELISYCRKITPTEFCNLEVVYEALAKEPEQWGEFIYEEYQRIFNGAKSVDNPFEYTSCLDVGFYFENKNLPFVDKIIKFLSKELDNRNDALRHIALWLLSDWIDDKNFIPNKSVVDKMAKKSEDKRWEIRYITNLIFKDEPFASNYNIKLRFLDKIRAKISNPFEFKTK